MSGILNRCTSPDPAQRFQSAAELKTAVLNRQKLYHAKKIILAALICPAIIFIPKFADEITPPPEVQPPVEIQTPVIAEEKIAEISLPNQSVAPVEPAEKSSGKVEFRQGASGLSARLGLISPQIEINFDSDETYTLDEPTIANGASLDLNIPLGGQLAAPLNGTGHLQVIIQAPNTPPIFFNRTFKLIR